MATVEERLAALLAELRRQDDELAQATTALSEAEPRARVALPPELLAQLEEIATNAADMRVSRTPDQTGITPFALRV